ncbi:hypothetical protein [Flavobacterium coralii]|uniref:hypothetical protein n=1 Tax=Flavobacterium coralii TaxID=2838017 RepID=UPI00268E439D|tara:strand:+ start:214 stop:369 length:156 start_codon:yes stop_codon:yes gene_type:complete
MKTNRKITRKELANILEISEKTARKEYKIIMACLQVKRKYLTSADLQNYGI